MVVLIIGIALIFFGLFIIAVWGVRPYEVEYQEPYEVPYQETLTETIKKTLLSIFDFPGYNIYQGYLELPPTYYTKASVTLVKGQNVSVSLSHATEPSLPIDLYIFTEENFEKWKKNSTDVDAVASWINQTDIEDRFIVPQTATYVVVIWNPRRTLFTTTVYIRSIEFTVKYQKTITITKIRTEYRTKYRTEYDYSNSYIGGVISVGGGVITLVSLILKPKRALAPSVTYKIMFCPHCGTQLPHGAMFCPNCGRKLINS